MATGKIEHQQEGQAKTLQQAVSGAWDKLTVDVKSPAGPCGQYMGVTLFFASTIEDVSGGDTFVERV